MKVTAMFQQEIQKLRLQERAARLDELRKPNDLYLKNHTSTYNWRPNRQSEVTHKMLNFKSLIDKVD